MKNCSNCKHRDKFITEEPCLSCKYTEEWEPKEDKHQRVEICGWCANWRCDDPLHLTGHCVINRMDVFHETRCKTCKDYIYLRSEVDDGDQGSNSKS